MSSPLPLHLLLALDFHIHFSMGLIVTVLVSHFQILTHQVSFSFTYLVPPRSTAFRDSQVSY